MTRYTQRIRRAKQAARLTGWALAAATLTMLLLQLFAFEAFIPLVAGVLSSQCAVAVAALMVILQLSALPFWLGLETHPWLRQLSMALGVTMLMVLTIVESMALSQQQSLLLGAVLSVPVGSWPLTFLAALWLLAGWRLGIEYMLKK